MKRSWLSACLLVVLLLPLGFAAWRVFPISDDAWSALYVKENGAGQMPTTLHRTLLAQVADALFVNSRLAQLTGILAMIMAWGSYAWMTVLLWQRIFPAAHRWAPLAGALVLTPAVATTHLMTWMLLLPVQAPALLGLWLVLLIVEESFGVGAAWWAHYLSVCLALLCCYCVSEYSVAATGLALVALTWRLLIFPSGRARAAQAAGLLISASAIGWSLFRFVFSRPDLRPDAGLGYSAGQWLSDPLEGLAVVPTRIWWTVVGAYGQEMGTWKLLWGEKSTIAAFLFGLLCAGLAWWAFHQEPREESAAQTPRSRGVLLSVLLLSALLPEIVRQSLMSFGNAWRPEDLATRFLVQAMPFGACLTVAVVQSCTRVSWHSAAVLFLGFLAGHTAFAHSYARMRAEATPARLGDALLPYVEKSVGPILAITSEYYGREYEIVYKATRNWPPELTKRLWIMYEGRTLYYFGEALGRSGKCLVGKSAQIDSQGLRRNGDWSRVLWVKASGLGGRLEVEDYCVVAARP